jgi:hypothetical protein
MKKLIVSLLLCLPLLVSAQNNSDPKYLTGAVPEIDGRVMWSQTFGIKGKTAQEVYNTMLSYVQQLTKGKNVLPQTRIVVNEPKSGDIVARFEQWMVFKNKPLCLDRTRVYFQLAVKCEDGKCHLDMTNVRYLYEEERDENGGKRFKAEEWINDKYGLNKNKTKLAPQSGKFRKKTIDLKDDIFSGARKAFGEQISVKSNAEVIE